MVTVVGASTNSQTVASQLATYLGRTASPAPSVQAHSGQDAIRVGLWSEWHPIDPAIPDHGLVWDYVCEKIGNQYYILGRTDHGLQLALSQFLRKIGYHRLASGQDWEILPSVSSDLAFPGDVPAAQAKMQVFQGAGTVLVTADGIPVSTDRQTTRSAEFSIQTGQFNDGFYQTGHAFGAARAKPPFNLDFDANPNWIAGPNKNATNIKFCTFESGLWDTMYGYALTIINATNPRTARKTVSMSASDGSAGWDLDCAGTHEQNTKNASERIVKLANEVQARLRAAGETARVAILCYSETCVEPSGGIAVDPDVVIVWATSFTVAGYTPERCRDAYLQHGAVLHFPYSYPAIWTVGHGLPPGGRSFKRSELAVEVDRLAASPAPIGWSGESPLELMHARWHRSLIESIFGGDPLAFWDGYAALAFPSAPAAGAAWYAVLDRGAAFSGDVVRRLAQASFDLLDALGSSDSNNTREIRRARSLGMYAVFCALYRAYQKAPNGTTMDALLQWIFLTREYDVVSYGPWFDLSDFAIDRQKAAALHPGHPADLSKNVANWTDTPITDTSLRAQLTTAIANNNLIPFEAKGFSDYLVRVGGLVHGGSRGTFAAQSGTLRWTYHASGSDIFTFQGAIGVKGPSTFTLTERDSGEVVWQSDIPNDNVTRDTSPGNGTYPTIPTIAQRVYYVDAVIRDAVAWHWQTGTGMVCAPDETKSYFSGGSQWFFYVPLGTTTVGFFAKAGTVEFQAPDTSIIASVAANNDYYSVAVPDGLDGQPWRVKFSSTFAFLTVPPQLAFDENELMLPLDVVEADGLQIADATPSPIPPYTPETYNLAPANLVAPATPLTALGTRGTVTYYGHPGVIGYLLASATTHALHIIGGIIPTATHQSVVTVTDLVTTATQVFTITNEDGITSVDYVINCVIGRRYKIELTTQGKSIKATWDAGTKITAISLGLGAVFTPPVASHSGYLYVKKGATVVGFYADGGSVSFYDKTGKLITKINCSRAYYQFTVPAGVAGTVIHFVGFSGRWETQAGSPPCWAMAPGELLLPSEIVTADSL